MKKNHLSPSDKTLFQEAMKGVRPLNNKKAPLQKKPSPKIKIKAKEQSAPKTLPKKELAKSIEAVSTLTSLFYQKEGFSLKTIRQLKRGKLPINHQVDLHGMTIENALESVENAILKTQSHTQTCLLVIHGKGYSSEDGVPKIKNALNRRLREYEDVIAFCSALPKDGGTGAIYLLIRAQ